MKIDLEVGPRDVGHALGQLDRVGPPVKALQFLEEMLESSRLLEGDAVCSLIWDRTGHKRWPTLHELGQLNQDARTTFAGDFIGEFSCEDRFDFLISLLKLMSDHGELEQFAAHVDDAAVVDAAKELVAALEGEAE